MGKLIVMVFRCQAQNNISHCLATKVAMNCLGIHAEPPQVLSTFLNIRLIPSSSRHIHSEVVNALGAQVLVTGHAAKLLDL
jgi:hypothetical protein